MSGYWSKSLGSNGVGHFERKFQGGGIGSTTNDFWRRGSGLSRGVVCMILRLAVLVQCGPVTDTRTDTR